MPEDIITSIIAGAPNLIVALWVLWRDDKRITALLEQQRWLMEQLLAKDAPEASQSAADGKEETD